MNQTRNKRHCQVLVLAAVLVQLVLVPERVQVPELELASYLLLVCWNSQRPEQQ
jgi:hypothetical protein